MTLSHLILEIGSSYFYAIIIYVQIWEFNSH